MNARCLHNRAVIVTGGARGIGRAVAHLCAELGAKVLVDDIGCDLAGEGHDPTVADAVTQEIAARGGEAVACVESVASEHGPRRILQAAQDHFGRVDALIHCAGVRRDRPVLRMSEADLDVLVDVHLRGAVRLTQLVGRALSGQSEGGSIVLSSSSLAFFGNRRQANLAAVSAAVIAFARCAAVEFKPSAVRVNVVAPLARTRATEQLPMFKGIRADSLSPEQVAPVYAYLASPLAREVSGEVVGAAGSRAYVFRTRESTGAFAVGPSFDVSGLSAAWHDVTRV